MSSRGGRTPVPGTLSTQASGAAWPWCFSGIVGEVRSQGAQSLRVCLSACLWDGPPSRGGPSLSFCAREVAPVFASSCGCQLKKGCSGCPWAGCWRAGPFVAGPQQGGRCLPGTSTCQNVLYCVLQSSVGGRGGRKGSPADWSFTEVDLSPTGLQASGADPASVRPSASWWAAASSCRVRRIEPA